MPKQKTPGTVTHTIFLPEEVHRQITRITPYGGANDLIVECVTEAIKPRYQRWVKQEYERRMNGPRNYGTVQLRGSAIVGYGLVWAFMFLFVGISE